MTKLMLSGPRRPPASGGKPKGLVIALHGYGSNGDDLIGLAPYWERLLPDVQFSAPHAITPLPGFAGAHQWFPIGSMDPSHLAEGARTAAPILEAFIQAEMARFEVGPRQTALVGFSQGTMMALQVGLSASSAFAGILGYSGGLVGNPKLASKPEIQLVHGDEDPTVPVAASQMTQDFLRAAGIGVNLHISPRTGHTIALDGLQVGGAFLARVLKPDPS